MCWLNVIVTGSLDTGPAHLAFDNETRSGSGNEYAPLARCPGSETLNAASPALEMTFAVVEATYSRSTPGTKAPNDGAAPSDSDKVAGTEPPTLPGASTRETTGSMPVNVGTTRLIVPSALYSSLSIVTSRWVPSPPGMPNRW